MKIQVLGSGCSTCHKLFELTKQAAAELQITDKVEYCTDVSKIVEMGVMSNPVLALDGRPALVGFVPDIGKIKEVMIHTRSTNKQKPCGCSGECC